MELGLEGKLALVTASSSGLGFATARALSAEGAVVAVCSRSAERAGEAARRIAEQTGNEVFSFEVDVSDGHSVERLFGQVERELGGLDILVNNAGGPPPGGFENVSEEQWDLAYGLTLQSVVRSVRHTIPLMRERGGGSILTIGSSSLRSPIPNLLLSNVFRPAVLGLSQTLAGELAPYGIRVNMISPGRIHTERIEQLDRANAERQGISVEEIRERTKASIPLGRLGDPAEFGRVAAFLSSDAASYISGESILVDGGMVRTI